MEVKIKKLHKDAVIPYKVHPSDFCYDCVAISEEEIAPNVWRYGLGIAFEINRSWEHIMEYRGENPEDNYVKVIDMRNCPVTLSIDARPRSSVWKTGMVLSNCEGTIDEDFRGGVSAVFYHIMPEMPRYKVGDRVCQIKLGMALPIKFIEVDELSETDRGTNGYGSTGK